MKRGRILKTLINLLAMAVVLTVLWSGLGFPLPAGWAYRRMERAMLVEPMEILWRDKDGTVISAGHDRIGLYTGNWVGYPMNGNEMYLFPMEQGAGYAVRKGFFFEVDFWAYEASGQAVEAELKLDVWQEGRTAEEIRLTAAKEDDVFHFPMYRYEYHVDSWQERAVEDLVWHEMGEAMQEQSSYRITITFYDEAGTVVAVRENGGSYDEN